MKWAVVMAGKLEAITSAAVGTAAPIQHAAQALQLTLPSVSNGCAVV